MKILPEFREVKKIAESGQYNVVPISCEILSDFTTPIETMKILKNVSTHCYMLESAVADEQWGRYTFLGFAPKLEITCIDGEMQIGNVKIETENPSEHIRQILADYKSPRFAYLPSFTGGLVGYFSYDYLGYSEPSVRCRVEDSEAFKDVDLMLFDKVIAFDHVRQKIILIVNMSLDDIEVGYNKTVLELKQLVELLKKGEKKQETKGCLMGEVIPLFEKEQFCGMVEQAKQYIREGDIFQIVLSNRLSAPFEGSLLNTYRMLRTINPSPYMFYFSGTDVEVAGASPETLVKLENGILHTFPLAGTRPRGKTNEEDRALSQELLADEKELAEHNMLVDLGRNDLGKISRFGTVKVEKFHTIEYFSHVMHIGSTVRGEICKGKDALDAIEAVLPAGTLSGAPKIRACQLIGELENNKRGIYGGAIGYIDFTGNMDTYKPAEGSATRSDIAITDPDFKYPSLWKSNIAADYKFGDGWVATIELLYSKDINAIYHDNIGLYRTEQFVNDGGAGNARPYYNGYYSDREGNQKAANHVVMLRNTSKGHSLYTTFQLQKNFVDGILKGLYLNGSYSFGQSRGVTDGTSSVATSAWKYRAALDGNAEEVGYTAGSFDGRLLLSASYTANWSKYAATSFGLIYQRYRPFRYSYCYNGDANGDSQFSNDLMYIPANFDEVKDHLLPGDFDSQEDAWKAMNAFIEQDPYLSKHRGEYAERNGAVAPFANQLDLSVSHDIKIYQKNGRSHTLRFSFNIANFLNLFNRNWGVVQTTVLGNQQYQFLTIPKGQGPSAANNYTLKYTMAKDLDETFKDNLNDVSRWQMQFGIKYIF